MSLCGFNCMFSLTVNTACAFRGQDMRFGKKTNKKKKKKKKKKKTEDMSPFRLTDRKSLWSWQTQLCDKLLILALLSLLMPRAPCYGCLPKTPTWEDIVWMLNLECRIGERRSVCACLYICVCACECWGGSLKKKKKKEKEKKEKESDLVILSLSTLCFVLHLFTEFPHWLGRCSFSPRPELA